MTPGFKPFTIHDLWDHNVFYFFYLYYSPHYFLVMASSHSPCHSILSNATIFGCEIICARKHLRSRQIICGAVQLSYNTPVICRYFLKQLFCTKTFFGCHYPSKNGNNPFLKTHGLRPLSSRITVRASMLIIIHFGVSRWLSLQISTSDPLKRNSRMILFSLVVVNICCVSFIPGSCFSPSPHSFHAHTQAP